MIDSCATQLCTLSKMAGDPLDQWSGFLAGVWHLKPKAVLLSAQHAIIKLIPLKLHEVHYRDGQ